MTYDSSTQGCCNGHQLYSLCCYGRVISRGALCIPNKCGVVSYNPSILGCCNDRIRYFLKTQQCCYNRVISKNSSCTPRCGLFTYDPSTQGCCGSKHRYSVVLFYYYTKLNLTVEAITAKLNNQELYSKFNVSFGLLRLSVNPDIKQEEIRYQELRYATYTRPKEKKPANTQFQRKNDREEPRYHS